MLPDPHQASSGTGAKPDAGEMRITKSLTPWVRSCVSTGNGQEGAQPETMTNVTNALGVEDRTMELSSVHAHRRINALTPYKAEMWRQLLHNLKLLCKYPHIPHQIQYGFNVGIHRLSTTFTPENSPTIYSHSNEYLHIVDRELSTGRYIGPLS
jgi:hypothetical protein